MSLLEDFINSEGRKKKKEHVDVYVAMKKKVKKLKASIKQSKKRKTRKYAKATKA